MAADRIAFWFDELDQKQNELVGKKGANLGEMVKLGMPVAPGFAVSLDGCRTFLSSGARTEISRYLEDLGEIKDIARCDEASRVIRSIIEGKEMVQDMREEISSCYRRLCERTGIDNVPVSIRSSGVTSRPGMFDTILNVRGEKDVLPAVKKVWASMFSSRAIWYRLVHNIPGDADVLGVVVQQFVDALSSGIMFGADPVTGDTSRIVVEATWGLGEGAVGGKVQVDLFVLDKTTLDVQQRTVADKLVHVAVTGAGVKEVKVPCERRSIPCISDEELKELGRVAKFLEERLSAPQDIEWATDPDLDPAKRRRLFQTRPVKFSGERAQSSVERLAERLAARF